MFVSSAVGLGRVLLNARVGRWVFEAVAVFVDLDWFCPGIETIEVAVCNGICWCCGCGGGGGGALRVKVESILFLLDEWLRCADVLYVCSAGGVLDLGSSGDEGLWSVVMFSADWNG